MGKPHVASITFEERVEIEKLVKQGLSCGAIAKALNRSKNGIVCEVRKGGKADYCAKRSQKITDEVRWEKYRKLSERNKGIKLDSAVSLKTRIDNLEMQLEILHDLVKELIKR